MTVRHKIDVDINVLFVYVFLMVYIRKVRLFVTLFRDIIIK